MGTDWNIWVSGTPPGGSGPVPLEAHLAITQPVTAHIGGTGTAVGATVGVGGSGAPIAANASLEVGGGAKPIAASASVGAQVSAELKTLPDVVVRVREIPKFELVAPTHFKVGFSIFGFEVFAITLTGEGKLRST